MAASPSRTSRVRAVPVEEACPAVLKGSLSSASQTPCPPHARTPSAIALRPARPGGICRTYGSFALVSQKGGGPRSDTTPWHLLRHRVCCQVGIAWNLAGSRPGRTCSRAAARRTSRSSASSTAATTASSSDLRGTALFARALLACSATGRRSRGSRGTRKPLKPRLRGEELRVRGREFNPAVGEELLQLADPALRLRRAEEVEARAAGQESALGRVEDPEFARTMALEATRRGTGPRIVGTRHLVRQAGDVNCRSGAAAARRENDTAPGWGRVVTRPRIAPRLDETTRRRPANTRSRPARYTSRVSGSSTRSASAPRNWAPRAPSTAR